MKLTDRLKKRSQFLRIARKGRKVVTPGLIAQVLPGQKGQVISVGFTVTKKVGNSVVRNRTRRRLREAFRLVASEASSMRGGEIVLIGRATTRGRDFSLLKEDVRRCLVMLSCE
ncbi:ribonuclease P protein component [Saccharibacter sp. 17.LH.SD]|uniref:ribonuclease P protein component n=1 Tax=Saccharibacter sp. 17.LH.SD TaxID=2689393 RepID=UPI00136A0C3C|nr:ribonuclease P protein component [Saccharibacter sp. 17.LH.SD]MXV44104.1 ribonuclease P protein component [Saccharibacter sp. 17.LH.SD]